MNNQTLAAQVAQVAGRIGMRGPVPPARMVSAAEMAAVSFDPARPALAKVWREWGLLWNADFSVTDAALIHELAHWLLVTSPVAGLYPHADSDVNGHGPLFAAMPWSLAARGGVTSDNELYDLGHNHKPGDLPADAVEERWARRWARRPHEGAAEALAARAIRDYRRLCQGRALVAATVPLVRLLAALAAAMAAPALLAHMI
ncbi:MAG: hypothetical protein ACYCXX_13565 [Acidiferrobacter thiooxydans]